MPPTQWIHPLRAPADLLDALLAVHREHNTNPSPVALDADTCTRVWALFTNAEAATSREAQAHCLPDGLLLGHDPALETEAVLHVQYSTRLHRNVGRLFALSGPVPGADAGDVASLLDSVYPRWRSIRAPRRDDEPGGHSLEISRTHGRRQTEVHVSSEDVATMQQVVAGGACEIHELRFANRDNALVLDVGHDTDVTLRAFPGAFGLVVETVRPGVYVHGARALMGALLRGAAPPPRVFDVPPLAEELRDADVLTAAVRSLALQTSYDATDANEDLFRILGIQSATSPPMPPGDVSVYPLATHATAAGVHPAAYITALRLRGVPPGEATLAARGAYAVHTRRHLFGVPAADGPVALDGAALLPMPWRAAVLRQSARAHLPAYTLQWHGQEITVSVIRHRTADAVVFALEGTPFAIAATPRQFVAGAHYQHQGLAAALSQGQDVAPPTLPPHVTAPVTGDSLRAAACRLAYIDLLVATAPAFLRHQRTLRTVWLHSEKVRLAQIARDGRAFRIYMGVLAQLLRMPPGCHYDATVPYLSAADLRGTPSAVLLP